MRQSTIFVFVLPLKSGVYLQLQFFPFELAIFQVLSNHLQLVATVLGSATTDDKTVVIDVY